MKLNPSSFAADLLRRVEVVSKYQYIYNQAGNLLQGIDITPNFLFLGPLPYTHLVNLKIPYSMTSILVVSDPDRFETG